MGTVPGSDAEHEVGAAGLATAPQEPLVIEVALNAAQPMMAPAASHPARICIVVDVVRATTTLCLCFERGARQVQVARSVADAQAAWERYGGGALLAGEIGGARPPGFHLGNSPSELAQWDLSGRELIYATTNGTRALHACRSGGDIFAGSLRNASALARAVIAMTTLSQVREATARALSPASGFEIVIVCAGLGEHPAFDDTLCAGYLVRQLALEAQGQRLSYQLGEGAYIARAVCEHILATIGLRSALGASTAGRAIAAIGLEADLDWCAAVDATEVVPIVVGVADQGELLAIEPYRMP